LSAILLFSDTRAVYGQALNRDIEELLQDIVSDVINRTVDKAREVVYRNSSIDVGPTGNIAKKRKDDPLFTRRYRFTWRQNEKEDVAPLGVAFGRINLGRMRNDSRHRGRSTRPRESVKKGGFGDGRGGLGSTIGLRPAISLL
jgi:hypothetical protein